MQRQNNTEKLNTCPQSFRKWTAWRSRPRRQSPHPVASARPLKMGNELHPPLQSTCSPLKPKVAEKGNVCTPGRMGSIFPSQSYCNTMPVCLRKERQLTLCQLKETPLAKDKLRTKHTCGVANTPLDQSTLKRCQRYLILTLHLGIAGGPFQVAAQADANRSI